VVRLFGQLGFTAKSLLAVSLLLLPLLALLAWQGRLQYDRDMAAQQQAVRHHVEVAHQVLAWAHGLETSGALSRSAAQQLARSAVAKLRYGQGDYFWINDMHPVMVMHPVKPELDGKDLSGFKDPNGFHLFKAFVDVARRDGAGLVAYQWPKPGNDKPLDKISYVKAFQPWGWVIGTGIYVDNVLPRPRRSGCERPAWSPWRCCWASMRSAASMSQCAAGCRRRWTRPTPWAPARWTNPSRRGRRTPRRAACWPPWAACRPGCDSAATKRRSTSPRPRRRARQPAA